MGKILPKPFVGQPINKSRAAQLGCVGAWLMNEGAGNKIINAATDGQPGVLGSGSFASGGIQFDAGYIDTKYNLNLNALTIICKAETPAKFTTLFSKYDYAINARSMALYRPNDYTLMGRLTQNGLYDNQYAVEYPISNISSGTHSFGLRWEANAVVDMIIDRELVAQGPIALPQMYLSSVPFVMGSYSDYTNAYSGLVEYTYVFNRSLSVGRIQQLHDDPYWMWGGLDDATIYSLASTSAATNINSSVQAQSATGETQVNVTVNISSSVQAQSATGETNVNVSTNLASTTQAQPAAVVANITFECPEIEIIGTVQAQSATGASQVNVTTNITNPVQAQPATGDTQINVTNSISNSVQAQPATADANISIVYPEIEITSSVKAQPAAGESVVNMPTNITSSVQAQSATGEAQVNVTVNVSSSVQAQSATGMEVVEYSSTFNHSLSLSISNMI